jgi:hypothetical protein
MEIILSIRGGSKLCSQGYMYTKHTTMKTYQWWKCVKGQVQGAEEALALHFRMKIQFLGSHTITLPVLQAPSTQKPEMPGKTWQPTPETKPARSLPRLCPSVTTMSKPCCP